MSINALSITGSFDRVCDKLRSIQENENETYLFPILEYLFEKKGYKRISTEHGPNEYGKDLVFSYPLPDGDHWCACVVKNRKADKSDANLSGDIRNQIDEAFKIPHKLFEKGIEKKYINKVFVIVNSSFSQQAIDMLHDSYEKNHVEYWNFEKLTTEIDTHIKEWFLRYDGQYYNWKDETKQYYKWWLNLAKYTNKEYKNTANFILDKNTLEKIKKYKEKNRFIKYSHTQAQYIDDLWQNNTITKEMASLLAQAFEDTKLAPQYYNNLEKRMISFQNNKTKEKFETLVQRFEVLSNYTKKKQVVLSNRNYEEDYNKILEIAFSFDFTKLKNLLLQWKPKGHRIQVRSVFLSFFIEHSGIAKQELIEYLKKENLITEKCYATTLMNIVSYSLSDNYTTDKFEQSKIETLWDFKNYLISELKTVVVDVNPYGVKNRTIHFGNSDIHKKYKAATRVLQFLIDSGLILQKNGISYGNTKDWYLVAKELYKYHPYPVLWYTIQLNDNNILKRIGQDFAYATELKDDLKGIVKRLLQAYFCADTPLYFKPSILRVVTPMFASVEPEVWEKSFYKIWHNDYLKVLHTNNIRVKHDIQPFIFSAARYIKSETIKNKIILDCISGVEAKTEYIDVLANLCISTSNDIDVKNKISEYISNMNSELNIVLAGNLYRLFDNVQLDNYAKKIIELTNKSIKIPFYSFNFFAAFAKEHLRNSEVSQQIKEMILQYILKWCSIKGTEVASPTTTYPKLNYLEKFINWSDNEVVEIYNNLKTKFLVLKDEMNRVSHLFIYDPIQVICEIYYFINKHIGKLKNEEGFEEEYKTITEFFLQTRKYKNLDFGLLASDEKVVDNAINELIMIINSEGIQENIEYLNIILDRIVLKKKELLYTCIEVFEYYLKENSSDLLTDKNKNKLIFILENYTVEDFFDLDLDLVTTFPKYISIAEILKSEGNDSDIINDWIMKKERFNYPNEF